MELIDVCLLRSELGDLSVSTRPRSLDKGEFFSTRGRKTLIPFVDQLAVLLASPNPCDGMKALIKKRYKERQ